MKTSITKVLLLTALSSSSFAIAGSNNGYTTGANIYSGSSSRGWYGGGVTHVLAEWKKEKAMAATAAPVPVIEVSMPVIEVSMPVTEESVPVIEVSMPVTEESVPVTEVHTESVDSTSR